MLTFNTTPRFQVPTRLGWFQLSSGSDIERYQLPRISHNPIWYRTALKKEDLKVFGRSIRGELSDCSSSYAWVNPIFSFVPLSYPFLSYHLDGFGNNKYRQYQSSQEDIESPTPRSPHLNHTKQIIWPSGGLSTSQRLKISMTLLMILRHIVAFTESIVDNRE